jgi:hypothetical protein
MTAAASWICGGKAMVVRHSSWFYRKQANVLPAILRRQVFFSEAGHDT